MTTSKVSVRLARLADVSAIREVTKAAYRVYVDRIGREPAPMTADHSQIVKSGRAWIAEQDGRIVARAHNLDEVRLYTNEAMIENLSYYPRRGYRETHRATQDGFRRVFFAKVLA